MLIITGFPLFLGAQEDALEPPLKLSWGSVMGSSSQGAGSGSDVCHFQLMAVEGMCEFLLALIPCFSVPESFGIPHRAAVKMKATGFLHYGFERRCAEKLLAL